jgi:phage tail sheath protein FI
MANQQSPGINFREIDLTTVIPSVSVSTGAFAGVFRWGPVEERFLVDSEDTLVKYFGKPTNFNAETFFTAANFLAYSNQMYITRAANTSGATPYATFAANSGNNVFSGNTSALQTGMYVFQASNGTILPTTGCTAIVTSVNSTAFVLSNNASGSGSVTLYFANPQTTYSAVALEQDGVVANLVNQIVKNESDYFSRGAGVYSNGVFISANGNFDTDVLYIAKYPGNPGNSLRVSICDSINAYSSNIASTASLNFTIGNNTATAIFAGSGNTAANTVVNQITIGDQIMAGNGSIGYQYLTVRNVYQNTVSSNTVLSIVFEDPYRLHTEYSTNTIQRYWEFYNTVGVAPGQSPWVLENGNTSAIDEIHVVVVDEGGVFSGTPGTILEVFKGLSRASDAKNTDSTDNYYKNVINQNSGYIWWANDRSTARSAPAASIASSSSTAPGNYNMVYGSDGLSETDVSLATLGTAYSTFVSAEDIDIGILMQGRPAGAAGQTWQLANYLIDNIAETRRDLVVTISPDKNLVLNQYGEQALNEKSWADNVRDTSYAMIDSGYKYQYDRYSDLYRWIPLNGDIAGLLARTDQTNNPWWSPAGYNRGAIKNVAKLAYNPRLAERNVLYANGINPVVTFPGKGTILYGDKTHLSKPSAFDRIGVRRLFIVLEKAISTAAKYTLFDFNDDFTRSQFKNMVNPYLRTIQGLRGITDYLVVCDLTNNTADIIDGNQFVGDIYIKPNRSINWITLNFVAVGTGVQFSYVIGKY